MNIVNLFINLVMNIIKSLPDDFKQVLGVAYPRK